jgi:hypothetical protein
MEVDKETFEAWRAYWEEPVGPHGMPRHMQLRQAYMSQRYLGTVPWEVLEQRMRDILVNLTVITENKRTGLPPIESEAEEWMVRFGHIEAERGLRFGPYPAGLRDSFLRGTPIPRSTHPLVEKAVDVVRRFQQPSTSYLVKFGKHEHMQEALQEGGVLVSPATSYKDPSLNPAIRDDELSVTVYLVPDGLPLSSPLPAEVVAAARASSHTVTGVRAQAQTDYYVYCMCTLLVPRLFVDFEYDACLVITNPSSFLKRLIDAMQARLPDWTILKGNVTYLDPFLGPLTPSPDPIGPYLHKHFRYAYQKEYRLAWLPSRPDWELEPIKLTLGKLTDVCQLLRLT